MCELSQDGLICRTRPIGHMWLGFAKSFFVPAALLSNSSNEQKTGLNWLILNFTPTGFDVGKSLRFVKILLISRKNGGN